MAKLQAGEHLGATKIEVAPLHARGLIGLDAVLDGERRRDRRVQDLDRACQDLDLPRCHVRVDGFDHTGAHLARDLEHVLTAQVLGNGEIGFGDAIRVDDALRITLAVAKVDEDEATVVTIVPHPSSQGDFRPHILAAQLSASMGMHAVLVEKIRHEYVLLIAVSSCRSRNTTFVSYKHYI